MSYRHWTLPSAMVVAAATALFAQSYTFSDSAGNFSVTAPGPMTGGNGEGWIAFSTKQDGVEYYVQYRDLADISMGASALLDAIVNGVVNQSGGNPTERRSIQLNRTYPGRYLVVEDSDTVHVFAVYLVNDRLYGIGGNYRKGGDHRDQVDQFIDSFRLLN